ncbi:hypothetical protein POM88_053283 [Heracleum sosnowskyi]|uniref:Uncharacterized protein n=1 Tax=Heracleum sosnowskyi TaxID=360622 RepID=A0AAD8GPX9_9APIA|nr:hypothetical protein POM88_053283 [Heracleum sosnowskyi]
MHSRRRRKGEDDDLLIVSGSGGDRKSILSIRKTVFHDYDVRLIRLPICAFEMILVGSCDGLLCLIDKPKNMERILLWTSDKKIIKVPPTKSRNISTGIGFGYVNRNDYKVISLVDAKFTSLVLQVYSLSEDI